MTHTVTLRMHPDTVNVTYASVLTGWPRPEGDGKGKRERSA